MQMHNLRKVCAHIEEAQVREIATGESNAVHRAYRSGVPVACNRHRNIAHRRYFILRAADAVDDLSHVTGTETSHTAGHPPRSTSSCVPGSRVIVHPPLDLEYGCARSCGAMSTFILTRYGRSQTQLGRMNQLKLKNESAKFATAGVHNPP